MANDTAQYCAVNSNWSDIATYISIATLILIDAGAILLNLLVVVIIIQDSLLREKADCILIANLALSDLLVALTIIPFSIEALVHREYRLSAERSAFIGFANFFFCIASIMTLLFLVLDQTCIIKWPLRYERYRTRCSAIFASLCCWLHSAACALPPALGLGSYNCFIPNIGPCSAYDWIGTNGSVIFTILVTTSSWGIALIGTVVCYIQILAIVVRQQRRFVKQKPAACSRKRIAENSRVGPSIVGLDRNQNSKMPVMSSGMSYTKTAKQLRKMSTIGGHRGVFTFANAFTAQLLAIQAQQKHVMESVSSDDSENVESLDRQAKIHDKVEKNIWNPAKTLLLIICIYFFSWSPFCIVLLTEVAMRRKLSSTISLICLWIGHSSSLLNPILYFLRYKKFRILAIRLLRNIHQWFVDRLNMY